MTSASDVEAEELAAELKNAPVLARRANQLGVLLGLALLLGFGASAWAGHLSWGKAAFYGLLQLGLFWFVSFSFLARLSWGWAALLLLAGLRFWSSLGPALRLLRMGVEENLWANPRETLFYATGAMVLPISVCLIWLLLSREVREFARQKRAVEPAKAGD